ncbi:MAG: hypothetical protein Alpg2KO_12160 [Alphaproteobacteria bacterium]
MLDKLSVPALHDLYLRRQDGQLVQIDHLLRLPDSLMVIETKNLSGRLYGTERQAKWTQMMGRRKFSMQNPLRQNYRQVETVRELYPASNPQGLVVMAGSAKFAKDKPNLVIMLKELHGYLSYLTDTTRDSRDPAFDEIWHEILSYQQSSQQDALKAEHLQQLKDRFGDDRRLQRGYVLMLAGACCIGAGAAFLL